ncbi:MAG: hypothetical protein ABJG15_03900 [Hyphomonadaceae bacterium]
MSKPIFPAIRQFMLSTLVRFATPRHIVLSEPEPKRDDLHPQDDLWLFDAPRELSAYKADYGQAMSGLSGHLASVRDLLSRISPVAPLQAEDYAGHTESYTSTGVVWSDTILFDGEPAPMTMWGESAFEDDLHDLFEGAEMIKNDLIANELFGGYGSVPALAS